MHKVLRSLMAIGIAASSVTAHAEGGQTGFFGIRNKTIQPGGIAPNGYRFAPESATQCLGVWDETRGYGSNNTGVVGIINEKRGYAAWEVEPAPIGEVGREYEINAMVFHSGLPDKNQKGIEVKAFNSNGQASNLLLLPYGGEPEKWYALNGRFVVPGGTKRLQVRLRLSCIGSVFFDAVRITPASVNAASAADNSGGITQVKFDSSGWEVATYEQKVAPAPVKQTVFDGKSTKRDNSPMYSMANTASGVEFMLRGEATKWYSMAWASQFKPMLSMQDKNYVIFEYRASGIGRNYTVYPTLWLDGKDANGDKKTIDLLNIARVLNDDRTHVLIRKVDYGMTFSRIVAFLLTESDSASLAVENFRLAKTIPANTLPGLKTLNQFGPTCFTAVSIDKYFNNSLECIFGHWLEKFGVVIDGIDVFPSKVVSVADVPFSVGSGKLNVITPKESVELNDATVEIFGSAVQRASFIPIARDDKIKVAINSKAKEVLLLMALFADTIEQDCYGIPSRPLRMDDIETVSIEINYESGRREIAFPYSLADRGAYIPARMLGAYAIATDPAEKIRDIIIHNSMFGVNFSLAAVTLNNGNALAPELTNYAKPQIAPRRAAPASAPVIVEQQGEKLIIGNRYYRYTFDLLDGFSLAAITYVQMPDSTFKLSPASGLEVRVGNTIYTGRSFKVSQVKIEGKTAMLELDSSIAELPLKLLLKLQSSDSPELTFMLTAVNTGKKDLSPEISFPAIKELQIGNLADSWMFFPQYRNVNTTEKMALKTMYGNQFQFQFMDTYNPDLGAGLTTMTRNPEQRITDFFMCKNADGITSKVSFMGSYNKMASGAQTIFPEVALYLHDGDWKQAAAFYRDYLTTFYRPYHAQDKAWFRDALDMKAYITCNNLSQAIFRTPPVKTSDHRYLWKELFEIEEKYLGHVPEFIHFFNWTYFDDKKELRYAPYAADDVYAFMGGLEKFRTAITEIQDKYQHPQSLYTIYNSFCPKTIPAGFPFDAKIATTDAGGNVLAYPDSVATCFGSKAWRDYVIKDIIKLQKDTGCKIIYLDVFGSFLYCQCYNPAHGHPVPSNVLHNDIEFIKALREALPADVALWTEFPLNDYARQYVDGNVCYYFLDLSMTFARYYNRSDRGEVLSEMPFNLTRFITPGYRQFMLPCGIECGRKPSQVDAAFFNGEAFHEVTWRLHNTRIRAKLNNAYQVAKKYRDCFTSPQAELRAPTEASGILANRFEGKNRTAWTLYNTRPNTYSGPVLSVNHIPGARYIDAWNNHELSPEIIGEKAILRLNIDPQQPGCIVQEPGEPQK